METQGDVRKGLPKSGTQGRDSMERQQPSRIGFGEPGSAGVMFFLLSLLSLSVPRKNRESREGYLDTLNDLTSRADSNRLSIRPIGNASALLESLQHTSLMHACMYVRMCVCVLMGFGLHYMYSLH